MTKTSIFSRIFTVLLALGVLGLTYWFISTSMMPVSVPQQLILRSVVRFDPKLDISTNRKFLELRPLGEFELSIPALGRENPFLPPVVAVHATNTVGVTSTQAIQASSPAGTVTSSEAAAMILPLDTREANPATTTGQ